MRYLTPFLLLFFLLIPLEAQEEMPFPVLQAEDIFAEGVTVLERLPLVRYDDNLQEIYYFNPASTEWETIAYPESIDNVFDIFSYEFLGIEGYVVYGETNTLWLNPTTQLYQNLPRTCGVASPLTQAGWNIYMFYNPSNIYLCNSETESRIEVSESVQSQLVYAWSDLSHCIACILLQDTPDGHYAFISSEGESPAIFVFDLVAGVYLHEIPYPENEPSSVLFHPIETEYLYRSWLETEQNLWKVDITQPDSWQLIVSHAQSIYAPYGEARNIYLLMSRAGAHSLELWDRQNNRLIPLIDNLCNLLPSCEALRLDRISPSRKYLLLRDYEANLAYLIDIEREELLLTLESWNVTWSNSEGDIVIWHSAGVGHYLRINEDGSFTEYTADSVDSIFGLDQVVIRRDSAYFLLDVNTSIEYSLLHIPIDGNWYARFFNAEAGEMFVSISTRYDRPIARWRIRIDALSEEQP